MTTPFAQDRPDWVPTLPATVVEIFDFDGAQAGAVVNHGRFYVGTHPYLWIRAFNDLSGLRIVFAWYASDSSTDALGTNEIDSNQTDDAAGSIACQGAYVEILTQVQTPPDNVTLRVWSSLHPAQSATQAASSQLIVADDQIIGAGATVSFEASRCRWGWGFYSARLVSATAFYIRLYAIDFLGQAEIIDISDSEVAAVRTLLVVPPRRLRLTVFNADAVARRLFAKVLIHPIAGI